MRAVQVAVRRARERNAGRTRLAASPQGAAASVVAR
jgi:hypothetical protein